MTREDVTAGVQSCPVLDELAAFTHGQLPLERLESIAAHVSGCKSCESSLQTLQAGDTIVEHLRREPERASLLDEPECRQLEDRARAIPLEEPAAFTLSASAAAVAPGGPLLPAAFGAYLLLERLGHGGMGIVYKARQEALKRPVALKLVRAGIYASTEERARFQREGEAIARVQHANVVQIHEFGEHQGQLFFSMELLEGGTLASKLNGQPLPEREAAELVRTLARAVYAAHQQGIVHRDLKPSNVLFAADGTPKITDFGLAKILDQESGQTQTDAVLGTPAYMAPEQARGESRTIGPAADVYALGAILYETLTGQRPFKAESRSQMMELVRTREPEAPSRYRRGLARDLEAICLKCLEKQPARRYVSAEALADDLDRWLRGASITVRPPGWPIRLWRRLRRRARLASAAALLLFLAIVVPAGLWYRDPERPIRAIEAELAWGRPQMLIDEMQGPRWSRWCAGQVRSQMSILTDGTFILDSWQSALLELVRDPQRSHYRFSALVRQEKGVRQAEIGIYVAHRTHALPAGVVHQFVVLGFYDIERDKDLWAKVVAKPLPVKPPPPPKGNPVLLDPHLYAERAPVPWEPHLYCGPRDFFDPAGVGGKDWRELAVEVTPEGVKGFWGGKAMGTLTETRLVESTNDYLTELQKSQPDDPLGRGFDAVYAPRGGLGLYVHNGSASFRRVVIEPLD